ncbi:MAG: hypothetical protein D6722_16430 [Bacteroidetes bacterium]|nr:MAG: hypothetical protein D6722_16430 [Bacteroidota bacterium]
MTQELMERIDAYLRGELSPAERQALEAELAADDALRVTFEAHRQLLGAIELEGARQTLAAVMAKPLPQVRPLWARATPYLAVAAAICLLMVWAWPRQTPHRSLFETHYSPAPGLPTTLGETDALRQAEGMVAYKRGDYAGALSYWQPLLAQETASDTLRFFAGVAELGQGNAAAAADYLTPLTQKEGSAYQTDAAWYLGLAYLKLGQLPAARTVFQALAADDTYGPGASSLLEELAE